MSFKIGLDLGSTAIKAAIVEGERLAWHGVKATAPGQENLAEKLMREGLAALGAGMDSVSGIVSTGYGKKLFSSADRHLDEITSNALGAFARSGGEARTVVNVGGQDLKILTLDHLGNVTDFKMNDKCAAGTGRFFELAARILDTPLEEFAGLSLDSKDEIEINSTCVVFAESEIVSLLARGVKREDVIKALHCSVARRISGLMGPCASGFLASEGGIYLDGGPAKNSGLVSALEDELLTEVRVLELPQFTVAYGAALSLDSRAEIFLKPEDL
ncbi:MAG: acyl-CoA dehydratase activase [Synergistaceae bacterium]|jgi:predicted CoA-substrate-specific enzyme activase|nr:acyl-CoA dehydratase activase [Synergistaceae bacterium]